MRRALEQFLDDLSDFEVGGATETAEAALQALNGTANVDLALIDTRLPGMNGIELVKQLQARHPDLPCLMYSGHGETTYVEQALDAGARGYVLKGDPDELPTAIRRVLNGEQHLSAPLQKGK